MWLSQFQTTSRFFTLRFKRYRDTDADEAVMRSALGADMRGTSCGAGIGSSATGRKTKTATISHVVTQPVTGITCLTKLYFYMAAVATKFVIGILVLVAGSGAVLRSDNDFDLILNSVAASFILEIDNFAYALFVPSTMKRAWSAIPPIGVQQSAVPSFTLAGTPFFFYLSLAALFSIDYLLHEAWWCTDLAPGTPYTVMFNMNNTVAVLNYVGRVGNRFGDAVG